VSAIIVDAVSWVLIASGAFFVLVGALGLLRLPDFYTRMHSAGITDTLGAELLIAGMMVQAGLSLITVKLFLMGAFLFFTSPTSTHAIANAAHTAGLRPQHAELPERPAKNPPKNPPGEAS
jgi:multicomponent Na+:H+ antiporter subunit G